MKIQTAGEQIYYDFIEEESQKLRVGMIIWISMLAAALIASFERIGVGAAIGIIGIVLATINIRAQIALRAKTEQLKDKDEFFLQLSDKDTQNLAEVHLIITANYVVYSQERVGIIELSEVKEVQLEKRDGVQYLILIRKDNSHCVIASNRASETKYELLENARTRLSEQISL